MPDVDRGAREARARRCGRAASRRCARCRRTAAARTCRACPPKPLPAVSGSTPGSAAPHALGLAGRPRRVVHDHARRCDRTDRRRLAVLQLLVRRGSRGCRRRRRSGPSAGKSISSAAALAASAKRGVRDEDLRLAVVDDVRDLGSDEVPVDRDQVEAGLCHGEEQLEHLGRVREQHRDRVAGLESHAAESVHELVARRQELTRRDLALVGVDQREVVGARLGDVPEPECCRDLGRAHRSPWVSVDVGEAASVAMRLAHR